MCRKIPRTNVADARCPLSHFQQVIFNQFDLAYDVLIARQQRDALKKKPKADQNLTEQNSLKEKETKVQAKGQE